MQITSARLNRFALRANERRRTPYILKVGDRLGRPGTAQQATGSSEGFPVMRVLLWME